MAPIEIGENLVQIDAATVAEGLKIDEPALRAGMRDGTITSRLERGAEDDAGRLRLTFFSQNRRLRIVIDVGGCADLQRDQFRRPAVAGVSEEGRLTLLARAPERVSLHVRGRWS